MAREGKGDEFAIVAYSDVAKKARTEKIAEDILTTLFEESDGSEEFELKRMMTRTNHQNQAMCALANRPC